LRFAFVIASALYASVAIACGGAEAPAQNPQTSASATTGTIVAPPPESAAPSVVHFDDLGMTFAVPAGFHVIGDRELAARIGASANPHLQSDLRNRADAKKGVPLLALSKDELNFTLSVVVVPTDATAMELAQHQRDVMSANLAGFEMMSAPADRAQDGVPGAEMSTRYTIDGKRVASRMRLFVRNGIATLVTAVWSDVSQRADEAGSLLDGLKFQTVN
jgi:hypothetical protein